MKRLKRASELTLRQAETIINAIQVTLWFDEFGDICPDKQWSPDTISDIASILSGFNLNPTKE